MAGAEARLMTTLQCPWCSSRFEMLEQTLGGRATLSCPLCGRVIGVHDARIAEPGGDASAAEAGPEVTGPAEEPVTIGAMSAPMMLPTDTRVSLAVLSGPRRGEVVVLQSARLVLGRSGGSADLELPDPDMSPGHAAIECHGSRIVLRDLGGNSKTFIGGEPVVTGELEDRTEFRLGETTFMLILAQD